MTQVLKGFVNVGAGQVHFRHAGSGPPVVVLHDSPHSSVLHLPLLDYLSDQFTVLALDTPGYGNSTALPREPRPEIPDFGDALAECIAALGIVRCPVYGFHTSSKITLDFAAKHPERVSVAIMDGLSLPSGPTDHEFIDRYMSPFVIGADGSYLATLWTKVRDIHRYFPWFALDAKTRNPGNFPDQQHLHDYAMDFMMAGPDYASALWRGNALPGHRNGPRSSRQRSIHGTRRRRALQLPR